LIYFKKHKNFDFSRSTREICYYRALIRSINERCDVVILIPGFVVGRPRCWERACISSSRATLNTARPFYSGRVHGHLGYWLHPSYRHTDDEAGCLVCFGCSLLSMWPRISSRQVDTQSLICAYARKREYSSRNYLLSGAKAMLLNGTKHIRIIDNFFWFKNSLRHIQVKDLGKMILIVL